MIGEEIAAATGEELLRFVGALGKHRYVAGRHHLVHVFAADAASAGPPAEWAAAVLADASIDKASKDERLWRRVSDAELVAVLEPFLKNDHAAKEKLRAHLRAIDATVDDASMPFDESREEDVFPVLIDAGWELLPLASLDRERHAGAIGSFDDFEVARFEEENAVPPLATLHELPAFGATELLAALDFDGALRAPFVLWQSGNEVYLDYVLRGVLRAAKLA